MHPRRMTHNKKNQFQTYWSQNVKRRLLCAHLTSVQRLNTQKIQLNHEYGKYVYYYNEQYDLIIPCI